MDLRTAAARATYTPCASATRLRCLGLLTLASAARLRRFGLFAATAALWRADGSLLMSQRKQGDKDDATFWSTDGKALEKGSLAEMKAAQDMQALLPQLEQAIKLQEQLP